MSLKSVLRHSFEILAAPLAVVHFEISALSWALISSGTDLGFDLAIGMV
jgi:hypothetical protein